MTWSEDDPLLVMPCGQCQAPARMPCGFTLERRAWVHAERLFQARFEEVRRKGRVAFAAIGMRPTDEVLLDEH